MSPDEMSALPLASDRVPAYYIASVGRALTLISAFADTVELTVTEAAALLRVAPSTAHRILQMLVHHGYVVQRSHRAYVRSESFGSLSLLADRAEEGQSMTTSALRRLRDELGATVHLMGLEGNGIRFLAGAARRTPHELMSCRVGWLLPAHTLAGGKALLATLSDTDIQKLFPAGIPLTRHARVQSVSQLRLELREIRRQGYARSLRESHEDLGAVAIALPSSPGGKLRSLSAVWPADEFIRVDLAVAVTRMRIAAEHLASGMSL